MNGSDGAPTIRNAAERDLDDLAAFEVAIAKASFDKDAVVDPSVHRAKLAKALTRDPDSLFVAVDANDRVLGWLWFAVNTNFMTDERYINFRSFAVSPGPDSERVGEALMERGLRYAREHGLTEITGKVNVGNHGMRVLYRRMGFEPVFLTMRLRRDGTIPPRHDGEDGPA